jgi:Fe2+ or Zn2+ uptake regulation protein
MIDPPAQPDAPSALGAVRPVAQSSPEGDSRHPRLGGNASAVLATLRAAHSHPTAAELYDDVRRLHPRLGRATVYRALAALEAAGLAVEVWRDAVGRHYDARTDLHDHAICVVCGRVCDVARPPAPLPAAYAAAAEASGHEVTGYEVRYYGRCPTCRRP